MLFRTGLAALALLFTAGASAQDIAPRGEERPGDFALGDPDAPVLLIEYASVACPHCGTWYNNVWPAVEEDYINTGRVRFVTREMLTGSAPLALAGFMMARCAADDLYFDALDLLFTQQGEIFQAAQSEGGALPVYLQIAAAVGLNEDDFTTCLNNDLVRTAVIAAHEQAVADGIPATPAFIINGVLVTTEHDHGGEGHGFIYMADGEPLLIDGEQVPATVEADSFTRIIDYFEQQSRD